jgi:hypothetical protein
VRALKLYVSAVDQVCARKLRTAAEGMMCTNVTCGGLEPAVPAFNAALTKLPVTRLSGRSRSRLCPPTPAAKRSFEWRGSDSASMSFAAVNFELGSELSRWCYRS